MKSVSQNRNLHGNVPDHCPVALLLVDVLNDLDFPGGQAIVKVARSLAENIAALKRRCQRSGIPAIYVNDNWNKWRSDATNVIMHCLREDAPGRAFVEPLLPSPVDYIVLKPKHSAFYATPLDTMLSYLKTRAIVLVGLTTDACVLTTACEIHVRDLKLFVPSDCVAACNKKTHQMAIALMKKSFGARTTQSRKLDLKRIIAEQDTHSRE